MSDDPTTGLTPSETRDVRRLAGIMLPASPAHRVPGADDPAILDDIVRSLGRDTVNVRKALAMLREMAGGDFAELPPDKAEAVAMELLGRKGPAVATLGRAVLQCYYRDDRVVISLGLEPRAPFPKGYALPQGDWSLLDKVKGRARMWRDVNGQSGGKGV